MRTLLQLTGKTPLVMHNVRLADKDDPITRQIKELTDKPGKNRTDADSASIEHLEFLGGLYYEKGFGVYVPTWNIVRCLERGGTITRDGTTLVRALAVVTDKVVLDHDGPKEAVELWKHEEYRWRTSVGVNRGKVTRMRPIFRRWSVTFEAELLEEVMNPSDLLRVAITAGRSEGLGDARKLGYGRFDVEMA